MSRRVIGCRVKENEIPWSARRYLPQPIVFRHFTAGSGSSGRGVCASGHGCRGRSMAVFPQAECGFTTPGTRGREPLEWQYDHGQFNRIAHATPFFAEISTPQGLVRELESSTAKVFATPRWLVQPAGRKSRTNDAAAVSQAGSEFGRSACDRRWRGAGLVDYRA